MDFPPKGILCFSFCIFVFVSGKVSAWVVESLVWAASAQLLPGRCYQGGLSSFKGPPEMEALASSLDAWQTEALRKIQEWTPSCPLHSSVG